MATSSRLAFGVAALWAFAGCSAIGGADEFTDREDTAEQAFDDGREDCSNGIDDDDDGLVDCEDPDCGAIGYRCVAPPPVGWTGPVMLEGANCSGHYAERLIVGHRGLSAAPASCSECSCSTEGAACGATLDVGRTDDDGCMGGGCAAAAPLGDGACVNLEHIEFGCTFADHAGFAALASSVDPWTGTCTASDQKPMILPPQWDSTAAACGAPAGGGCEQTDVCAPPPQDGAPASSCVLGVGERECPSGYPDKTVLYTDMTDTRGCTECSCSAGSCEGTIELFDGGCDEGHHVADLGAPSAAGCDPFSHDQHARARYLSADPGCAPVPSQPIGDAAPSHPFTICCTP